MSVPCKEARQYIERRLAKELWSYVAARSAKAPLFDLPHETNLARALRDDLAAARKAWLEEVEDDAAETARRNESDFLEATNHAGEYFDFHSLRHTCGAWLAMAGEHPKVIQTVMRHSSITLTMDTYGHLFPGQEVDAANRFSEMFNDASTSHQEAEPEGTCQQSAAHLQRAGCDLRLSDALACDEPAADGGAIKTPNSSECVELGDSVRHRGEGDASSGEGTRTPDTRIMILHRSGKIPQKVAILGGGAAHSAAVGTEDAELAQVIDSWYSLPDAVRAGITAMVRTAR